VRNCISEKKPTALCFAASTHDTIAGDPSGVRLVWDVPASTLGEMRESLDAFVVKSMQWIASVKPGSMVLFGK
jgi:hypothetical protein